LQSYCNLTFSVRRRFFALELHLFNNLRKSR
jgi:hypothetical protein